MARPLNEAGIERHKQVTIKLAQEIHAQLRHVALKEGITLIYLADTVFREFLARYKLIDPSIGETASPSSAGSVLEQISAMHRRNVLSSDDD